MWTKYNLWISLQLPTWDVAGIQMCYSIIKFKGVCTSYVASLSVMHLTSQPWWESKRFINWNCIYFSSLYCFLFLTLLLNTCTQSSGLASSCLCVICSEKRGGKLSRKAPVMDECNRIGGKPPATAADWWASAAGQETLPQFFQGKSFHL